MTPSVTTADSAPDSTDDTPALAFGAPLRQAREEKGLSLQAVSDELYILTPYLAALEAEDFDAMPPAVFARGFLINYARFLGLDAEPLATRFDRACPSHYRTPPENINALPVASPAMSGSTRRVRINPWLLLALIALVVGAVALWSLVSGSSDTAPAPTATPTVIEMDSADQQAGAALNSTGSAIGASGSALGVGMASSAALSVEVTDGATVAITDADDTALVSKRLTAGTYRFEGTPPFNIQIDAVDKVALQMNGAPVDMSAYSQDNRADFTLMPE
ncbi:hypothetical protein GCM10009129_08040 [Psychrobacter aestuarii]|uniref:Cytoskeleton protein RodZ-like C-terminal domain-containing protein n=2 Tax=Psychrobacter aestuarii TaxID=556327 RepID=A0ABP3FCY3_9GAMM